MDGLVLTEEFLHSVSHVDQMPRTLNSYYIGQANREALNVKDADLLMLDSYADMNFSLWRSRQGGPRFWIHPKYLINREEFLKEHEELGRASLQRSVSDAVTLIGRLRESAPQLPVLFLNQQVEYYPKLADRVEDYYSLGEMLADQITDCYFGGVVAKDDLELADIGSCGPGNTLHFQGETYRSMIDSAIGSGLDLAIERRQELKIQQRATETSVQSPSLNTFGELKSAPCKFAELIITEFLEPDLMFDPHSCGDACKLLVNALPSVFESYFYFEHNNTQMDPPKYTPMMIDLEAVENFPEWISSLTTLSKRQFKKSEREGYLFESYNIKNHTLDIFEINNSKEVRSGGSIRSNLTRSIEEMGGLPTALAPVPKLACPRHWRQTFGVFMPVEGYKQGELELGKKMIAYISVVRRGDFALFAQIMGHGDYLSQGVVDFVTQKLVEASLFEEWGKQSGLRYIMYGGAQNGGEGLYNFKRRSGFKPYIVSLPFQPGYERETFLTEGPKA